MNVFFFFVILFFFVVVNVEVNDCYEMLNNINSERMCIRSNTNMDKVNEEHCYAFSIMDGLVTEGVTNDVLANGGMPNKQENTMNNTNANNVSTADTNVLFNTLMVQNNMLMEFLKVQQSKPTNDITIAPDLNKSIPVFNGLSSGYQALDWLQTVNGVANLHRWPDNFKIQSVRTNLEGAARHWFAARDITKWQDFETQFRKTFVGTVIIGDRWKDMSRRVQTRGENVREYFHEKVHLCKMIAGMSFYEIKIQILEGLYSKDLSVYLLSRHHANEDELLGDIAEYERLDASLSSRIRHTTDNKERDVQKPNVVRPPVADILKKDQVKSTTTETPIFRSCFNCGSKTHISP